MSMLGILGQQHPFVMHNFYRLAKTFKIPLNIVISTSNVDKTVHLTKTDT